MAVLDDQGYLIPTLIIPNICANSSKNYDQVQSKHIYTCQNSFMAQMAKLCSTYSMTLHQVLIKFKTPALGCRQSYQLLAWHPPGTWQTYLHHIRVSCHLRGGPSLLGATSAGVYPPSLLRDTLSSRIVGKGSTRSGTRWCKEHKDLDRFGPRGA